MSKNYIATLLCLLTTVTYSMEHQQKINGSHTEALAPRFYLPVKKIVAQLGNLEIISYRSAPDNQGLHFIASCIHYKSSNKKTYCGQHLKNGTFYGTPYSGCATAVEKLYVTLQKACTES